MKKTILCILIILTIGVISTLSSYKYNNLDNKKEKTVNDVTNTSSLALILIDENGNETYTDAFPSSSEYYLNFAKSYCENGSLIGWDSTNSKARIIASKSDDCKLYFNKGTGAVNPKEDILATNTLVTTTPSFSTVATDTNTNIYQAEDDLGTSYYFRGAATQNYVNFGGFYWRIVRINGDGTIRMIYDGTSAVDNGESNDAAILEYSYTQISDPYGVGYTYDKSATDSTQVDGPVKEQIDSWYNSHLKNDFEKYITDSIFCNDKTYRIENDYQYFGGYDRLMLNKTPSLKCTNQKDRYTSNEFIGNGYLVNPVGLMTADEIAFAGGVYDELNYDFYLYNDSNYCYWTMTPYNWSENDILMYVLFDDGIMSDIDAVGDACGIRPVINLRADLLFTGSGTVGDPYKVAGFE